MSLSGKRGDENKPAKEQEKYTIHHFILAKYILYIFAIFMLIPLLLIPIVPLIVPGLGDDKCENFEIIKFFATFMGPGSGNCEKKGTYRRNRRGLMKV